MLDVKRGTLPTEEGVTFDRMMRSVYSRLGNPFSFPKNAQVGWRYDVPLAFYDRLGSQTFNNLRVDVGENADERFLGVGWSFRETGSGISFRWAIGKESSFLAPLKSATAYRLEFVCQPFDYAGAPLQVIQILANGEVTGRVALSKGLRTYTVKIPEDLLRHNLNEIRFRFQRATSPASLGLSGDGRPLAARFDKVSLIRRP